MKSSICFTTNPIVAISFVSSPFWATDHCFSWQLTQSTWIWIGGWGTWRYVRMAIDALAVAMDAVFELVHIHGQLARCPVRLFNRKFWVTVTCQTHFSGYLLGGL